MEKIEDFYSLLREENQKYNLISRKSFDRTFRNLVEESKLIYENLLPFNSLIDIGSGAGFPGLIIKLLDPEKEVVLVEPSRKKASFLEKAIKELSLNGIEVIKGDYGYAKKQLKEAGRSFDYLTCIGIRKKEKFVEKPTDFIRKGYAFITGEEEVSRLQSLKKLKDFSWKLIKVFGKEQLFLVIIGKKWEK